MLASSHDQSRPTQADDLVRRLAECSHNSKEGKSLLELANTMVRIFRDGPKPDYIPELVQLSHIQSTKIQTDILIALANSIIHGTADNDILRPEQIAGFSYVLQKTRNRLSAASTPLGPVLASLQKRLHGAIQVSGNSTQDQVQLVGVLSTVIDILVDLKVYGIERVTIHEDLLGQLKVLRDRPELRLAQAAAYAHEGLLTIPADEGPYQRFLRFAWDVTSGANEIVSGAWALDPGRIQKAIPNLLKMPDLIDSAVDMIRETHDLYSGGTGGKQYARSAAWYEGLRFTDMVIRAKSFSNLLEFIPKNPCCKDEPFLCGLYAQLEKVLHRDPVIKPEVIKIIEFSLPLHPQHKKAHEWVHMLSETLDQPSWKAITKVKQHKLRRYKNKKYIFSAITLSPPIGIEAKRLDGGLLEKSWTKCETVQRFYTDVQLRKQYAQGGRLEIKRLSGDLLDIGQCYINLSIIESPKNMLDPQLKKPQRTSSFSLFNRLRVAAGTPEREMTLERLFDDRKRPDGTITQPRRILIRGRAGVGKTTLCKKIVHDFVHRKMWANLFDRVIWIPLRGLKGRSSMQEFFQGEYFSMNSDRDILIAMLQKMAFEPENSRTLWLLDGLDEISGYRSPTGADLTEIFKDLLSQPNMIITSRPHAVGLSGLIPYNLEVETVGFHPSQVQTYLAKAVPDTSIADQIRAFIQGHWLIQGLVQIPIQLDALCYSWDDDFYNNNSTQTMTAIYRAIELKLWKKDILQLEKMGNSAHSSEIAVWKLRTRQQIHSYIGPEMEFLEYLAFTGLYNDIVEFDQGYRDWIYQQPQFCKMSDDVLDRVSFLRASDGPGRNKTYHFLHLTFQEFFAAQYFARCWMSGSSGQLISLKPRSSAKRARATRISAEEFLRENKYSGRYDVFWRFVTGLLRAYDEEQLCTFLNKMENEPRDLLGPAHQRLLMHCFSEIPSSEPLEDNNASIESLRERMELGCVQWSLHEHKSLGEMHFCSETEFPEHVLTKLLKEESTYQDSSWKLHILRALARRWYISSSLMRMVVDYTYDDDARVRRAAVESLGDRSTLPQEILHVVVSRLDDNDDQVRWSVVAAIGNQSGLPQEILDAVVSLLNSNNADTRDAAFYALSGQPALPREVLDILISRFDDSDGGNRWGAFYALSNQSNLPEDILDILISRMNSSDAQVRRGAVDTLRNQSTLPQRVIDVVVLRLDDDDGQVRQGAVNALGIQSKLPHDIFKAVVSRLGDDDWQVRQGVVNALRQQTALTPEILTTVVRQLGDDNGQIRLGAVNTLKNQSTLPKAILDTLVLQFSDPSNNEYARQGAVNALGGRSKLPQDILDAVVSQVGHGSTHVRQGAMYTLGNQSVLSKEVIAAISPQLSDNDWLVRLAALNALRKQATLPRETVDAVISQFTKDDNGLIIDAAITALDNQSTLPPAALNAIASRLTQLPLQTVMKLEALLWKHDAFAVVFSSLELDVIPTLCNIWTARSLREVFTCYVHDEIACFETAEGRRAITLCPERLSVLKSTFKAVTEDMANVHPGQGQLGL